MSMTRIAAAAVGLVAAMSIWTRAATKAEYAKLADEIEARVQRDVIGAWFPHCVDRANGGFHAEWSRDWKRLPSQGRTIVFQSRMTWVSAQVAMRYPARREEFLGYARHGVRTLSDVLWDKQRGGFLWSNQEKPDAAKLLYGHAFGIYGAAAAYQATGDQAALDLAKRAFQWLEEHYHDEVNGGYFDVVTADGKPIPAPDPVTPQNARMGGFIVGYKSQNAHIHTLEALAELYKAWKDPLVRKRLEEMLVIVRDKIAVEPGCLNLWLTWDWRAVPDHDSFGHDIETGFLLLEAAESLGLGHEARTMRMARMLVDHTLDFGFDHQFGGVYDKGYAFSTAHDKKKVWWSAVEGLNALLLMHELHGKETDRYWQAFVKQWSFIRDHMIDPDYPGIYEECEADGRPIRTQKGHQWKAAYHDGRSFMNTVERLRRMSR